MEAKKALEDELLQLRSSQATAEATRNKAEQDLSFEQEVRRAAALSRDEAEKLLDHEKRGKAEAEEALVRARENAAAAEQAAKDHEALKEKEEEVLAFRIQLGEKEAEVRHASKMENLRCSVEIEKLKSELEWKTRMLRMECEDLEVRLEDSDRQRRAMERALTEANADMRMRRKEGEMMKKMLDELVSHTEGARDRQDTKQAELSAVRDSIVRLKEQAADQLSALADMKELNLHEYQDEPPRERQRGNRRDYLDRGGSRDRDRDYDRPRPPR